MERLSIDNKEDALYDHYRHGDAFVETIHDHLGKDFLYDGITYFVCK